MKEQKTYIPRILVVDDEQAILDEFQEVLSPATDSAASEHKLQELSGKLFGKTGPRPEINSFNITTCHQGDEAVEKVRAALEENKPFAVAFLDVRMPPGPDGVWTAENIRALDPDMQLVIVTAYSDIDPVDISRRVLPADKLLYVQKPFHPHEIRQFASALGAKWLAEKQLRNQAAELTKSNERLKNEIEEHKRTQEKRRLLSHAVMSTDDSVYITDMKNKIIFVNRAFCETYRYEQEEVLGQDCNILWIGKSQSENSRSVFQTRVTGSAWEVGFYHKRKDDSIFPVSLSRSIVKDETGKEIAVVGVVRDISERILMEDKLRTDNLKLTRQIQLKTESIAQALEELKTPLTVSKNIISEAMASAFGQIDPRVCENLQLADVNINRAAEIVSDFSNISNAVSNEVEVGTSQGSESNPLTLPADKPS